MLDDVWCDHPVSTTTTTNAIRPPETRPITTSPCRTRHSVVFRHVLTTSSHPCVLRGGPRRTLCYILPTRLENRASAHLFPNVACGRVLVKVLSMQIPWTFDPRSEARKSGSGLNFLSRACVRVDLRLLRCQHHASGSAGSYQYLYGSRVSSCCGQKLHVSRNRHRWDCSNSKATAK